MRDQRRRDAGSVQNALGRDTDEQSRELGAPERGDRQGASRAGVDWYRERELDTVWTSVAGALPVAAAGISVFTTDGHRVPLGASDDIAALAERLQFTAGEGPCLSVHGTGQALLATEQVMAQQWPTFHNELVQRTPFRSIVSIPLDQPGLGGDAAMDLVGDPIA